LSFFKTFFCLPALMLVLYFAMPTTRASAQGAPPSCQNILIIYDTNGPVANPLDILQNIAWQNCTSLGQNSSGQIPGLCTTVTVSTTGVPASLAGYTEVWDLRFNQNTCTTAGGCPTDDMTTNITQYESYLASGGSLFLMGDNCGFPGRDTGIVTFVQDVTGSNFGSGGVQCQGGDGCCAQLASNASAANGFPTNWFALSGAAPGAGGGQIWTEFAGYVNDVGTGIPVYVDDDTSDPAPTAGAPEAVVTAFPNSSLASPYSAGKLMVAFDWQEFRDGGGSTGCGGNATADGSAGSEGTDANSAYILNSFTFLATSNNTPTPTPTGQATSTFTPSFTSTSTTTPSPTVTNTPNPAAPPVAIAEGPAPPPNSTQAPGATNVPVEQVKVTNNSSESVTLSSVTFQALGTGNSQTGLVSVQLYLDVNGTGVVAAGDTLLGTGTYNAANGIVTFNGSPLITLAAGASKDLLLVYNFSGTAPAGTYSASLANGSVAGGGQTSNLAIQVSGGPVNGAVVTIPANTPTFTQTPTMTATPAPTVPNVFYVSQNLFRPSQGPVSIFISTPNYPGNLNLTVYNTAGEHIRTLIDGTLSDPTTFTSWDGKNKYGDPCASGVYIFYLVEAYESQLKKVVLVR
jgi:hypothetical protein